MGEWKVFLYFEMCFRLDVLCIVVILSGAIFGNLGAWNVSSVRSMRFIFSGLGCDWYNMFKYWDVFLVINMDGIFFKMIN